MSSFAQLSHRQRNHGEEQSYLGQMGSLAEGSFAADLPILDPTAAWILLAYPNSIPSSHLCNEIKWTYPKTSIALKGAVTSCESRHAAPIIAHTALLNVVSVGGSPLCRGLHLIRVSIPFSFATVACRLLRKASTVQSFTTPRLSCQWRARMGFSRYRYSRTRRDVCFMGIVQNIEFDEYSAVSRTHSVAMMVELFGSGSGEGYSGPVLGSESITDKIFDIAYMIMRSHGKNRGRR
jgi:hypothetical protein